MLDIKPYIIGKSVPATMFHSFVPIKRVQNSSKHNNSGIILRTSLPNVIQYTVGRDSIQQVNA